MLISLIERRCSNVGMSRIVRERIDREVTEYSLIDARF